MSVVVGGWEVDHLRWFGALVNLFRLWTLDCANQETNMAGLEAGSEAVK